MSGPGGTLGGMLNGMLTDDDDRMTCSRAQCRADAVWRLDWRNPKIHTEDRIKTWLACAEHLDYLREFLAARDFPLAVSPVAVAASPRPEGTA
jgi:hypothetical protein